MMDHTQLYASDLRHSGGRHCSFGTHLQMTPAETKRSGRPALHHHTKKPVTGHKSHPAHDYE
jgi:hypothetical protein